MIKNVQKDLQETVCFTGHRRLQMTEEELREKTRELIWKAIKQGYTHFVCGGALGFDMIAAEQVCWIKCDWDNEIMRPITLELAIPCKDHMAKWPARQIPRLERIKEMADRIVYVSIKEYNRMCMKNRNRYMVLKSALVIAYYEGEPGGTKQTIDFADEHGREIWYIK